MKKLILSSVIAGSLAMSGGIASAAEKVNIGVPSWTGRTGDCRVAAGSRRDAHRR